ncbi:FAD-dependent oxidoreductase [Phycicoccus ginsengisoli]
MTRVVVVGHGMVGSRFVEDLVAADTADRFDVTVLGAEVCEPYNRVLLSEVVAGTHDLSGITLPSPAGPRVTVHRDTEAVVLDREDRLVLDSHGRRHRYDALVLATGSRARVPRLRGLEHGATLARGVHPLRTIDDAREVVAATLNARSAVVLGAGVLGLEVACGLTRRGLAVTVVHPQDTVMDRQLDASASRVVQDAMDRLGIAHRVGVGAEECLTAGGRLTAVRLEDGSVLDADLLVLATGAVPSTGLAAASGLPTDRGVLVGPDLASPADRRVHAIGDCAQPAEGATGLVAQGWEQGRHLVDHLTGRQPRSAAAGATDVVRLKGHGLDVVTMGVSGSRGEDEPALRRLRLSDPDQGRHVEVVVSGGLLVGATCVGAGQVAADLVATYTRRTPVPADPAHLLLTSLAPATESAAVGASGATVCRCNGVTGADIEAAVEDGAHTVEEVAAATRATTGCGGCRDDVCALLGRRDASQPANRTVRTV